MSRAQRIRDYLAEHASADNPVTMPQIRTELGLTTTQLHTTLCDMRQAGIVLSQGRPRKNGYWLNPERVVKPYRITSEAKQVANRRRLELRRRREGSLPREERKRLTAIARAERLRLAALDKARKAAERVKARNEAAAARKARLQPRPAVKPVRQLDTSLQRNPPKPVAVKPAGKVQTVEEWLAAGNAPEVLPIGASAEPLRFIGFADFTNNFRGSAASEG